ncbi:MAG: tetratricopeptide repeat protein [Alloprevotella sp.]
MRTDMLLNLLTHSSFTRRLSRLFPLLLLLSLLASCGRENRVDMEHEFEKTLGNSVDLIYTQPERADSQLSALQQTLTDSSFWYRVEVFRGTSLLRRADTLGAWRKYQTVAAWCAKNPRYNVTAGVLHNHLGVYHLLGGRVDSARQEFERAFELLDREPKQSPLIATSLNLSDLCLQAGDLPLAARHLRYALFLCDSLHDTRNRSGIHTGLAQIYMELQNFEEAHRYFDKAREEVKGEDIYARFYYLTALGNCLYFEHRYPESASCFQQAYKLAEEMNSDLDRFSCLTNLGELHLMMNDLKEARRYLHLSDSLEKVMPKLKNDSRFYMNSLIADLALLERGDTSLATAINLDSLPDRVSSLRYKMLHYQRLEKYAADHGFWRNAWLFKTKATTFSDSLRSYSAHSSVAEMTMRYQRDTTLLHQRLMLADYEARNVRQRNIILFSLLAIIVFALSATLAWFVYRRRVSERFKTQMEQINELRMNLVRNRVSPHYVFNALGTFLPKVKSFPEIDVPMELLLDVLRGHLLASEQTAVKLDDELDLVKKFLALYDLSHAAHPTVTWHVDEQLLGAEVMIPGMSIQIPVENALKHAFPTPSPENRIEVEVTKDGEMLRLRISDNGQGFDPGRSIQSVYDTGMGLKLLHRTFGILNQYNSQQATLTIENLRSPLHGTVVTICVPLHYNYERTLASGGGRMR